MPPTYYYGYVGDILHNVGGGEFPFPTKMNRNVVDKLILKERFFMKDLENLTENIVKMPFLILNNVGDILTSNSLAGDPD